MQFIMKIDRWVEKFSEKLSFLGAVWIFLIMAVIVYDVVGRYFFNSPFTGTVEIVRNSIVGIAFFMIPWAMVKEKHVRTTIVVEHVKPKIGVALDVLAYLVGFAVFLLIIVSSWEPFISSYVNMEYEGEGAMRIVTYPIRGVIILGSVLTLWHCFIILLNRLFPQKAVLPAVEER